MTEGILALFACHTSSKKKYFSTLNNIKFLEKYYESFVIINSIDAKYNIQLKDDINQHSKLKNYFNIQNDSLFDFGKWIYALSNIDFSKYKHILLINDSIIIINHNIIDFFYYYKQISFENKLYAYNDSIENNTYFYPSYLLLMNSSIIYLFIDLFKKTKHLIINKESYKQHFIKNIINIHKSHNCFIKLVPRIKSSLFYDHESFYLKLLNSNIFHLLNHRVIEHFYKKFEFNENKLVSNILPKTYIDHLKKYNLESFFCIHSSFNLLQYKQLNKSLNYLNNQELIYHYFLYDIEDQINIISKNKCYIDFIEYFLNKKIKLPNDFNYNNLSILNYKSLNNGILKNILYFYDFDFNFNLEYINNHLNKDYFKIIYPEISDLNNDKLYLFFYNKFRHIELKNLPDDFNIELYKHKCNIKSDNYDFINYHYKVKGFFNKNFKITEISIYKLLYKETIHFSEQELIQHYYNTEIKEKKLFHFNNNFDPFVYKQYYINEFRNFNTFQLKKHYIENGKNENRISKLPYYFNIEFYKIIKNNDKDFKYKMLNDNDYILFYIKNELNSNNIKNLFIDLFKKPEYNNLFHNCYSIPNDFNFKIYKKLYPDLDGYDEIQCKLHYIQISKIENKIYSIPNDFNPDTYKMLYKDLENLNNNQLLHNYINIGIRENRIYKLPHDFIVKEYKKYYNDTRHLSDKEAIYNYALNHKDRIYRIPDDFNIQHYKQLHFDLQFMSDLDIYNHYIYNGIQEKRQYKGYNNYFKKEYEQKQKQQKSNNSFLIKNIESINKNNNKQNNKILNKNNENDEIDYKSIQYLNVNINELPSDFDCESYKLLNKDLTFFDNHEYLIKHYLTIGKYENRIYKIPDDFDPNLYKTLNIDLSYKNNKDLIDHYLNYGHKEGRHYKIPNNFDYKFYKNIYLNNNNLSNKEVIEHYLKYGVKNNFLYKLPNDFNIDIFKKLNKDLAHLDDKLIIKNFINNVYSNRIYK